MTAEQLIAQIKQFKKLNRLQAFFRNSVCLKYGLASFGSKSIKIYNEFQKKRRQLERNKLIEGK